MNKEYLFKFFWAINIVIPVILELLIRSLVLSLYIIGSSGFAVEEV